MKLPIPILKNLYLFNKWHPQLPQSFLSRYTVIALYLRSKFIPTIFPSSDPLYFRVCLFILTIYKPNPFLRKSRPAASYRLYTRFDEFPYRAPSSYIILPFLVQGRILAMSFLYRPSKLSLGTSLLLTELNMSQPPAYSSETFRNNRL